jgi:hypothetical protein
MQPLEHKRGLNTDALQRRHLREGHYTVEGESRNNAKLVPSRSQLLEISAQVGHSEEALRDNGRKESIRAGEGVSKDEC